MANSKEPTVVNKLLTNALKDLKSLNLKQDPTEVVPSKEALPAAKASPAKKAKAKKVAKQVSKKKPVKEAVAKPKKPPVKIKRLDDPEAVEDTASVPAPDPFTKKVLTKTVLKDGMIIVEPINNPFND